MSGEVPMRRRKVDRSLIRDTPAAVAPEIVDDIRSVPESVPESKPVKKIAAPTYKHWNVRLPSDLVERAYGACAELAEVEDIRSNVAFTVRAMEEYLDRLEREHNGGRRYHQEESPFSAGRPVSYRR